ncbi:unnamed protein product [Porites evermanni]|uniref:Uncharacterized protein n=1 Tax=Porites evermanni TaxID=104178 RepID=A0ABN8LI32_9CNID|nr:unnamed protein product [Porites evermanni]
MQSLGMDKFRVAFTRFLAFYSDNPSGLHDGETPAKWQSKAISCHWLTLYVNFMQHASLLAALTHNNEGVVRCSKILCSGVVLRIEQVFSGQLESNSVCNHNYNKILKSDWFSTALISALIGQFNRTVRVMHK